MKEIAPILDRHDFWLNAEEVMQRIGDVEMKEETEK